MSIKIDNRPIGLNARKLGDAVGCNGETSKALRGVSLGQIDERRDALRKLARRSAHDARLVERFQADKILQAQPSLTRRGFLSGAFGTIAASALPIPLYAQLAGHTPIQIESGRKYTLLLDWECLFNDWSNLPTYGLKDGGRVLTFTHGTSFNWVECSALGGSWYSSDDDGVSLIRNDIMKLSGTSNGVRRSLFLGAAGNALRTTAFDAMRSGIGSRVVHSVLAHCDNGAVRIADSGTTAYEITDYVGINNVIWDVGNDAESGNAGRSIWLVFDPVHGSWEDNFFWLNGAFETGAQVLIQLAGGGGPGSMTIADAASSFPANFGGCFTTADPGFVNYPGRTTYTDMATVFADFATSALSPLRGQGRHLTTVASNVNNSNTLTMTDPTFFRSVAENWGQPTEGPYATAGGMGCYIDGVGFRPFTSHDPEGVTVIQGAPITVSAGAEIWDLALNADIGMAQA